MLQVCFRSEGAGATDGDGWIHGASAREVVVPRHHFLSKNGGLNLFLVDDFFTPHSNNGETWKPTYKKWWLDF